MQKSLIISLCVLATFVLIEARPWYENYDGDYGYSGESEGGYDEGVRADDGYGYNRNQFSVSGGGGHGGGGYGSGGRGGGGYGSGGRGGGGYDSSGRGGGGYDSSGRGGGRGNGRGSGRGGGHGDGGRPSYPSNNGRGYNYAYIPEDCPYCKIRSFGDGEQGTNTFNLPKEAYI